MTEEKRMRENLQFYLRQINRAQEEERKRIARELHDDTIQYMVVLARQLDDLASSSKGLSDEERLRFENLRQQINSIMEGVRRLSHDLRPATLDRLGLLPALEWLASQVLRDKCRCQGIWHRKASPCGSGAGIVPHRSGGAEQCTKALSGNQG